jgi:hypothetical protein
MNPIEVLKAHYAARAKLEEPRQWGIMRASSIGYPLRRLMMDLSSARYPQLPRQDRFVRVLERGDQAHWALRRALKATWPEIPLGRFDPIAGEIGESPESEWRVPLTEGWEVVGHPDGVFGPVEIDGKRFERVVLEIKTMAGAGFRRFQSGKEYVGRTWTDLTLAEAIGETYYAQVQAHMWALELPATVYLAEGKDTNRLAQRIVPAAGPDYMTVILERARYAARALDAQADPLEMPMCEGKDYGTKPGTTELRWGCSYCPHWRHCYPTSAQWVSGKKLVTAEAVEAPADAVVLGVGTAVVPAPGWQLETDAEDE